jgi:integrase
VLATGNAYILYARVLPARTKRKSPVVPGPNQQITVVGGGHPIPKRTLNDRALKALKPALPGKLYDVTDTVVPGFGVRVSDSGRRTFILIARYPGSRNPTRRALGEYGELTLERARTKARDWLELIRKGIDPREDQERQRLAQHRKRANSFAAVAEDFIKDKLATERKGKEVERDIRREFMPVWSGRPIAEITPHDLRAVVKAAKDRGAPYQAHNLLGHARRLFSWAIDQQVYGLESSPCDRLKPKAIIGEKRPRSRIFDDDELRAFWRAAQRMSYPYGPALRMLQLTGQRHREVTDARWGEFDLEGKVWAVPPERFKSDATHRVPLVDDVCALLTSLPRFRRGDHLFSTSFGERPTVISDKIKGKLDVRMLRTLKAMARRRGDDPSRIELKPWVIHDLRRTLRTHLSALRIPDHIAEMVIGHGRQGLQRVYDQHRYLDEMREALAMWAARLRSIVEPPPANVVDLRARART